MQGRRGGVFPVRQEILIHSRKIKNNKQTNILLAHFTCSLCLYPKPLLCLRQFSASFFSLSQVPHLRFLPFFLRCKPSFAKVGAALLYIFLFHIDHLSHTNSFLNDLSLSLMNTIEFLFFYSSPSAKMPMIKDSYIN